MGKSITELSSVTRVGLDLAKNAFQVHGISVMGWTAPRTASNVPRWSLSKPIRREAVHGQVYHRAVVSHACWSRSGEERFPGPRRRREGGGRHQTQAAAQRAAAILRQACALRRGDGGMLLGASLGANAGRARARDQTDPAGACEALCPA